MANLFIAPSPAVLDAPHLFPLNSPGWSLFFELLVNLIFVGLWPWLTSRTVLGIAIFGGVSLAALSITMGGMGIGDTWPTFAFGFLRALTSFFGGAALHRLFSFRQARPRVSSTAWLLPLTLLPLFAMAPQGGWKLAYEFAFIGCFTPICIWACAHAAPRAGLARVYRFLGVASYAIYVLHYPLIELIRRALHIFQIGLEPLAPALGLAFMAALLGGAWVVDRFYDVRARKFLAKLLPS